jgi:hypothetical protein
MPREACRDFQRGQCTRGRSCRYTHDDGSRSRSRSRSRGRGRSRDREDPPALVFKEGDWNCSKCKGHNFSRRTDCYKCGEDRPRRGSRIRLFDGKLFRFSFLFFYQVVAVANQDLVPDLAKVAGIALGRVPGIVDVVALVAAVAHVLEIETENVVDAAEAEVVDAAEAEVEAIARRNPKRPLSLAAAARAQVSLALPQKSRKKNSLKPLRRLEADFS